MQGVMHGYGKHTRVQGGKYVEGGEGSRVRSTRESLSCVMQ